MEAGQIIFILTLWTLLIELIFNFRFLTLTCPQDVNTYPLMKALERLVNVLHVLGGFIVNIFFCLTDELINSVKFYTLEITVGVISCIAHT